MSAVGERLSEALERSRVRRESQAVQEEEQEDDEQSFGSQDFVPDEEEQQPLETSTTSNNNSRPSLEELQAERERIRRRSSLCSLVAVVVLLKLWIDAMVSQDLGFILLCLVGTSWTARILRYHQDREDELDDWIQNYDSPSRSNNNNNNSIRVLSYQAQLALAILESQRQMMEGGYGHPDGQQDEPGVSEEQKADWSRFEYQEPEGPAKGEAPHCSICLGEYETGEQLVKLPCKHVYHQTCIDGWTKNHTKCPLCNAELAGNEAEQEVSLEVV